MATYIRNIQGQRVELNLIEVDPADVKLDRPIPELASQCVSSRRTSAMKRPATCY